MAGEAAEFLLSLGDSVTPNAVKIASSLEGMSASTQKAITQAAKLDAMMAKTAASNAKAAQSSAKAALDQHKLAEANGTAATSSSELAGKLGELGGSATQAGGVVGKLQGALADLGPEGQAAAAAVGLVAIAFTATIGTLLAGAAAAIEVTQQLSQMTTVFGALAGSAAGGAAITAMVQKLGTELPIATSQLGEWAGALQRAGVAGKDLEAATRAIAAASALNPAGGAAAAQDTISKLATGGKEATELVKGIAEGSKKGTSALREMGLSVADLGGKAAVAKMSAAELTKAIEKALIKKGADPLSEMANGWPSIMGKAKEGVMSLFDKLGPAVKPFMAAVKGLFGEFSKGGSVINTLKPIVTAVFTTLFGWATKAVGVVHDLVTAFTKGSSAGGTMGAIFGAMKTVWAGLVGIFNIVKTALAPIGVMLKGIFTNAKVMSGISAIFKVIGVAIGVAVAAVAIFVATVAYMAGIVGGAIGAVVGMFAYFAGMVSDAFGAVNEGIMGAIASFGELVNAGGNIVSGLVSGLDPSAFWRRLAGMASAGLASFKSVLGIASPSRVMIEHGKDDIAGAAATGVDKGAATMDASMARLGAPPAKGKGGAGSKDGGGKNGATFQFNNCTFGAGMTLEKVDEMMSAWWERLEGEAGAAPGAAVSTPGPNWFLDRSPWLVILFAGVPARAALTKINGLSTKHEWKKAKSKETSGESKTYAGTTVADIKLTFLATNADEYRWLEQHWFQLKPVPGLGGGASSTPAPAAPAFALGSPAGKSSTSSTPSTTTTTVPDPSGAAPATSSSSTPSPGPRPPTISVAYPWLLWHGITAIAAAEWEGPTATDTNGVEVTITYSVQDPPKPAGVGTMAPAAPGSQYAIGGASPGAAGGSSGGGGATQGNASSGAAGT